MSLGEDSATLALVTTATSNISDFGKIDKDELTNAPVTLTVDEVRKANFYLGDLCALRVNGDELSNPSVLARAAVRVNAYITLGRPYVAGSADRLQRLLSFVAKVGMPGEGER